MKRYTHPPTFNTLISRKEGSIFTKEWFFLRPRLALETDNPSWERNSSRGPSIASTTGRRAVRLRGERLRNRRTNRLITEQRTLWLR